MNDQLIKIHTPRYPLIEWVFENVERGLFVIDAINSEEACYAKCTEIENKTEAIFGLGALLILICIGMMLVAVMYWRMKGQWSRWGMKVITEHESSIEV